MTSLFDKYDVPGPRYTSYPTVPYWKDTPTTEQWIAGLRTSLLEGQQIGRGAALYIHIPFCEALCTFCGCTTRITKKRERGMPYIQAVVKEWRIYNEKLQLPAPALISEIHLGGGTPTWLAPSELITMMQGILSTVTLSEDAEMSLEVDPRVTSIEHIQALYDIGFRRLSLGVQDFDLTVQTLINRVQSFEQVKNLTEAARKIGYTSINYDLIYGLPRQNLETIRRTIDAVITLKPDRIAFYSYAHIPWLKPGQRQYTEVDLPAGPDKRALYELGRDLLMAAGYEEIGMDHFALPHDGLWQSHLKQKLHRNFMGYMPKEVHPMIGLGMSAIGDSWTMYAQNVKDVGDYETMVANDELPIARGHILSDEDQIIRRHVLNLMTRYETEWQDENLSTTHLETVPERLAEAIVDELVIIDNKHVSLTARGKPFLRNICMAFDAALARQTPDRQIFSRTV